MFFMYGLDGDAMMAAFIDAILLVTLLTPVLYFLIFLPLMHQAESELNRAKLNLEEAQAIAHVGSWTYDMEGQITWSDELYRIFGVSPQNFTPNTETFNNLIHPDYQLAMQAWIDACVFRCIRPPIPLATGHPFQCKPATLG
jgi:hypothetical protein